MARRMAVLLAVAASLVIGAAPVLGAQVYTIRESGLAMNVGFTNVPENVEELPPGEYYATYVSAASDLHGELQHDGGKGVCVFHFTATIETDGSVVDESSFGACGDPQTLTIDRRLEQGRLVAAFPVTECLAWDDETGECTDLVELGELAIDLTLSGVGPIDRYRDASSGGTAGDWTYAVHGTGSSRDAIPSGSITLDGASLIDNPVRADANLLVTKTGWVEVQIGG